MNNEKEKLKYEAPELLPVTLDASIVAGESEMDPEFGGDDE